MLVTHEADKYRTTGLSVPFMIIDFCGAVFCMLSLAFKPRFDAVAAVTYIAVMVSLAVFPSVAADRPATT